MGAEENRQSGIGSLRVGSQLAKRVPAVSFMWSRDPLVSLSAGLQAFEYRKPLPRFASAGLQGPCRDKLSYELVCPITQRVGYV